MDDNVQKKLQKLFIKYTKNLPSKIQDLVNEWQEQLNHWDPVQFEKFHRNIHSLCGSAGTYGYVGLSKTARQLEVYLKNLLNRETITHEQIEKISHLVVQLRTAAIAGVPKHFPIFGTSSNSSENKLVYILVTDEGLLSELSQSLINVGYSTYSFKNILDLQNALQEKPSTAVIIDTEFLDKSSIKSVSDIQKQQPTPIPLFCIVPNADLLPRINAIRTGCNAFFQKPVDIFYLTQVLNHKCGGKCNIKSSFI